MVHILLLKSATRVRTVRKIRGSERGAMDSWTHGFLLSADSHGLEVYVHPTVRTPLFPRKREKKRPTVRNGTDSGSGRSMPLIGVTLTKTFIIINQKVII